MAFRALLLTALFGISQLGLSDVVFLKNGSTIEGTVEAQEKGKVRIRLPGGGTVSLEDSQVAKIVFCPSPEEQYKKKKALLKPDDVEGYYKLGLWCREKGLKKEAKEAFLYVIKLKPDHKGAREALGYVKDGEVWVTEEEYHRRRGEVLFKGRWLPKKEVEEIIAQREAKRRLRKLLRLIDSASRTTPSALEDRQELQSYPASEVIPALIESLKGRVRTRIFASRELARYPLQGKLKIKAVNSLAELVVKGSTAELRKAALETLKKINWPDTALLFCRYLFSSQQITRIYALQALFAFPDLRAIQYLIKSFSLAAPSGGPSGGIVAGVSAAYVREYQLIRAPGGRGAFIVLPRIGRISTGTGIGIGSGESVQEKRRKAELYLRVRLLRELTKKDFGYNISFWIKWWNLEGRHLVAEQIKAQKLRKKLELKGAEETRKEEKPPEPLRD